LKAKTGWFFFFMRAAIIQRKGRFSLSILAVTLSIAVLMGLYSLSTGIKKKVGGVLKSYGANIIVTSEDEKNLTEDVVKRISSVPNIEDVMPQIYFTVTMEGVSVEVIGLDVNKMRGFRLDGSLPAKDNEVLVGREIGSLLALHQGDRFSIKEFPVQLKASGFIERGGQEDKALILETALARKIRGGDFYSVLLIRAEPESLQAVKSKLEKIIPGGIVKTLRQVSVAEINLLRRMQLLMILVTIVVLISTGVGIASATGANVLERREEIGLFKSLGATSRMIGGLFLCEAVFSGILGGVGGFLFGLSMAEIVSRAAFGSYVSVPFHSALICLLVGVVFNAVSSYVPVREAMRYNPAEIMRGE
jgi:putative ABC transport system permease protein